MRESPTFLSFEDWVKQVFDHEVREPEWYWDADAWEWDGPFELTVEYLSKLFGRPLPILASYSDEQLNQGLWYLISTSCSNHMLALIDESVSLDVRIKCVKSIQRVFEQIFSGLCSEHLSHMDMKGTRPLNSVCYMWWDLVRDLLVPFVSTNEPITKAAIDVMEATLKLDSIACQESALHGLGHCANHYLAEVQSIIDQYLKSNPQVRGELKEYALRAREGDVL